MSTQTGPAPAPRLRTPRLRARPRRGLPRPVELLILALVVICALRLWVVTPYRVASDSMAPTVTQGQTVLVDRVSLRWDPVDRQDLVVFDGLEGRMLKRVVAVGGDRVEILDAVLHVNGAAVVEPYVDTASLDGVYFGPVQVPEGTVFVLGDDRFDSIDSRMFGPVRLADVTGRVIDP